jgi:hypothetical protein
LKEELNLDAYYYSFHATGVKEIDLILCAIATSGKAYHTTSEWQDTPYFEYPNCKGRSPNDWMQNAANSAAECIRELRNDNNNS